jgi:hypothetical protein
MNYESRGSALGTGLIAFVGGMVAWAIFGPKIKNRLNESKAWQELKAEVEREAVQIKDLTKDRYDQIVDEVTGRYAKIKNISRHELRDLGSDLKKHWERIQTAWRDGGNNPPDSTNQNLPV